MKLEGAIALSFFELPAHIRTRAVFLSICILHNFSTNFLFNLPIVFFPKTIDFSIGIVYNKDTKREGIIIMSKECPVLDERCPHLKIHYGRGWVEYCCGLPHPEEDCDDYIFYNGEDDE